MPTRARPAVEPAIEEPAVEEPLTVWLVPVPGAYIPGEPAAAREVTSEEAERLLAYHPPAYMLAPAIVAGAEEPPQPPTSADAVAEQE